MMIRLSLISTLLILVVACAPQKQISSEPIKPISFITEAQDGLVYRASFTYKDYSFSGLMVIKTEDENILIILMSELGPTIMSFRLTPDELEVIDMIDNLKKKVLLKQLELDLRLMLMSGLHQHERLNLKAQSQEFNKYKVFGKKKMKIFTDPINGRLIYVKRNGLGLDKVLVQYNYNDPESYLPAGIDVRHSMINMTLKLKLLS